MADQQLLEPVMVVPNLPKESELLYGMACCHSITIIDDELQGDPLDIKVMQN